MKNKELIVAVASVAVLVSLCGSACAETKKIYHWPYLKLTPYTSLQYNYMPNGDIDDRRAFYWGGVIGSDGLAFNLRGLLPHLIEGNWQEPVYTTPGQKQSIFEKVKEFQDTYAVYGCGDNFIQSHVHPPLYGEGVTQWRADVITGMTQKAELMAYSGVPRILLDLEFASQDTVSTDPQFWYDLGGDVITAMRTENTTFKFGFYPGLYGYWEYTLTAPERTNPRSIGSYPGETSIPLSKRNMRHALVEGVYNSLNGTTMWHFPGWTYSPSHMCAGTKTNSYVFNLESIITGIIGSHTAMLGSGIEYMPAKWDFGRTQTSPIGMHWKQPNLSLAMMQRNYDLIYQYTDYAAVWDHGYSWDDDGPGYLTYPSIQSFTDVIDNIQIVDNELPDPGVFAFASYYRWDSLTGQSHFVSVPDDASTSERLDYFVSYNGAEGYHITGKQADNFPDYVDTMIVAAGKDIVPILLRDADEYSWAVEYKNKGFFKNHTVVQTPSDPEYYGYLRPLTGQQPVCGSPGTKYRKTDVNKDCKVNALDFSAVASHWLEDTLSE